MSNLNYVEDNGFNYTYGGKGNPIIVLHGLMGGLGNFKKFLEKFPSLGYQVFMPELPIYSSSLLDTNVKFFAKYINNFINFLGLKNIAVLTPYPKDVNVTVYEYLSDNNINIESFSSFNLEYDSDIAQVSLDSLEKEISKIDLSNVDGLFVSCTALKIVDVLDKIEKKQNTIVISSNQAIIWDCLRSVGVDATIEGYGKLFVS